MNIVLHEPGIALNTGNIGRTCAATNTGLHLIKPYAFRITEKEIKRAGMDYWPHLKLRVYDNWEEFLERNPEAVLHFFSTRGATCFWDVKYHPGDYLVFGRESAGLPPDFYERYRDRLRQIPMNGSFHRSLNLANAASIALYEALRTNRER